MAKLDQHQLTQLAQLAQLDLTPEKQQVLLTSISSFLDYVNSLNQLDLSTTPTTNQVTNKVNSFREDEVKPSLTQAEALANAHTIHQGYFVVSRILDHD